MNLSIQYFIGIIIITLTNIYSWSRILQKHINLRDRKNYIIFFLVAVTILLNYFFINQFIRILTLTIFMSIYIKLIFKEQIKKSIFVSIITQVIFILSEFIFSLILVYIFKADPEAFLEFYAGALICNFSISLICIIFLQFKFISKFYNFLIKKTDRIKYNTFVILLIILMIAINIFTVTLYYDFNFIYLMLFNTALMIIFFFIVINSFYNKNKFIKVYDKYNTTLNSLKEYEDILDKYRISNHENRNQLLTVRNMISKNNKKALNYIDTIIDNKLKDNDKIMLETAKIPAGGLRGLIYSKVLLMHNLNINYELEISSKIRTVNLIKNIDDSTMLDICKIIGVYLDNSIQEVEKLDEKYINIEMYLEKNTFIISVSNNFKHDIKIDRIDEKGYTTKGNGRGYGLSLTKEIIDNNKDLSNEKIISKNVFTQILKIKFK